MIHQTMEWTDRRGDEDRQQKQVDTIRLTNIPINRSVDKNGQIVRRTHTQMDGQTDRGMDWMNMGRETGEPIGERADEHRYK